MKSGYIFDKIIAGDDVMRKKEKTLEENIKEDINREFTMACIRQDLKSLKVILDHPLEKNIEEKFKNTAFNYCVGEKAYKILEYLVFNYQIEKTEEMKKHLDFMKDERIDNMFKIRELNEKLQKELPLGEVDDKKKKI